VRYIRSWLVILMTFTLLLVGCTEGVGQMEQQEQKEIREKAIEYIRGKYNKEFEVTKVSIGQVTGLVRVRGVVKDGKDTEATVFWEKPDEMDDTYVTRLWTEELKPKITSVIHKHMDVRKVEEVVYSDGTKKSDYTGEVPSVFQVLENGGDPDFTLEATMRIYENEGKYEKELRNFLKEIQLMNFNKFLMEVFVVDDELKSAPEDVKESSYTLYRYNIVIDDIQKVDIDSLDLDQYKTVIKE
jgi:hypothetical protein